MRPRVRLTLALALALASTTQVAGCMHGGPTTRKITYAANAALAAAGAVLIVSDLAGSDDEWDRVVVGVGDVGAAPTYTEAGVVALVIAAVGIAGTVLLSESYDREHGVTEERDNADVERLSLASVAAFSAPSTTTPATLAPLADVAALDPAAERFTRQARMAARNGHCDVAAMLGRKVEALDPAYFAAVFQTEPAIEACSHL